MTKTFSKLQNSLIPGDPVAHRLTKAPYIVVNVLWLWARVAYLDVARSVSTVTGQVVEQTVVRKDWIPVALLQKEDGL